MSLRSFCPKLRKEVGIQTCENCIYFEGISDQESIVCAYRYKTVGSGWEAEEEPEEN